MCGCSWDLRTQSHSLQCCLQSTAAHRPLDVQQPAFDRMVHALGADRRLAEAFAAARWPVLDDFMACDGCALMLDLVQASPGERWADT